MAGGFSFDFSDFTRLSRDLDNLAKVIESREALGPKLAGEAYAADVQAVAPLGHMPGESHGDYRRSIHPVMSQENGHPICLIGTNKIQAKELEYGSVGLPGGVISAKSAPYLVFKTEDGKWHSVKAVHQPGHPHWRPTWDKNLPKYQNIMREALVGGEKK